MENPFKKLSPKQIKIVIAGTVVIAGIAEFYHHKSTGSWSPFASKSDTGAAATGGTEPSGTVTDPGTGQVYSDTAVDPITNLTYASEIANYGTVEAADSEFSAQYGTQTGGVTPQSFATGYTSNLASVGTSSISGNNVYTSNSAWAQAATAGLTDVGYDGPTVSAALGAYLTGTPLTPAQVTIVNTAIAEYGPAPVGNIQVIQQPVSKPSPTPAPKPKVTKGPVPDVVGESASAAAAHLKARGFKNSGGVAGNDIIASTEPKAGTELTYGSTVKIIPAKHKVGKKEVPETVPESESK